MIESLDTDELYSQWQAKEPSGNVVMISIIVILETLSIRLVNVSHQSLGCMWTLFINKAY